jgi:hypothetical protein
MGEEMITKRDKKTGRATPKYTQKQFNKLVELMRSGSPNEVYLYLDSLFTDERTKWRLFDKAFAEAKGN